MKFALEIISAPPSVSGISAAKGSAPPPPAPPWGAPAPLAGRIEAAGGVARAYSASVDDAEAMAALEASVDTQIADIKVIQFLFFEQWGRFRKYANDSGIYLFGDMPICIALDSADAWAHPEILRIDPDGRPDAVAGVPPDYFSEDGQLWGNPLYDWEVHERSPYRWWVQRLAASAELADMVRIDHFRGFYNYWEVPAGEKTAVKGRWLLGPGADLFRTVTAALGRMAGDLPDTFGECCLADR